MYLGLRHGLLSVMLLGLGLGLAGQVLALTLPDAEKLQCVNNNI